MKAILQRVTFAEVKVDGNTVGKIDNGFLILLGVAEGDTEKEADALSSKIATLRVFIVFIGKYPQSCNLCGYLPMKTIK